MKSKNILLSAIAVCYCMPAFAATNTEFNPDISLTISGRYDSYSNTTDYELPGFMLGGESERGEQGLYVGHSELVISSNVDDMFYGKLTTAIAEHEGSTEVELEEAYIETLGLGEGFTIKAGRFYSGIGYLNNQHNHVWDFADAPLVYRGLFGNQLVDDGLQINWLAPTDFYLKLGVEVLRGERFPAGGAANDGSGAAALFVKLGGDFDVSNAWQLGFSHWTADVIERMSAEHAHDDVNVETPSFSGDSRISGIDFVWKWSPNGNSRERNLKIQAEYFVRNENGVVELINSSPFESTTYKGEQSGWYAQTVYQFMPRWRMAYRFDQLNTDNTGSDSLILDEAGLDTDYSPKRSTLMLDYRHSEYSRLRLQLAKDDSYDDSDNLVFLQYIVTLGAHGAHQF